MKHVWKSQVIKTAALFLVLLAPSDFQSRAQSDDPAAIILNADGKPIFPISQLSSAATVTTPECENSWSLTASLNWGAVADWDFHLQTPNAHIYYGNRSADGFTLDHDAYPVCGSSAPPPEVITGNGQCGTYTLYSNLFSACGGSPSITFSATVTALKLITINGTALSIGQTFHPMDGVPFTVAPGGPVQITKADITTDTIEVVLSPATDSGNLVLTLEGVFNGGTSETTLFQGVKSGGTYTFSFGAAGLPPLGQYGQVRATWTVNGNANSDSKDVAFFTLGTYRHSQYNTPSEADPTCQSGSRPVYVTDSQCNFSPATLLAKFVSQVNLNGSGRSINFGFLQQEQFCTRQNTAPKGSQNKSFRQVGVITAACAGMALDGTTVARKPGHPYLSCGDQVLIVGLGGGTGGIKTVTDLCPGCPVTQLDNYTTDGRCAHVPDLGHFVTIRLR